MIAYPVKHNGAGGIVDARGDLVFRIEAHGDATKRDRGVMANLLVTTLNARFVEGIRPRGISTFATEYRKHMAARLEPRPSPLQYIIVDECTGLQD